MKKQLNITDLFMNEVVMYGGFPVRRADIYRHALRVTGDKKAADMFAFSDRKQVVDLEPITLAQLDAMDVQFGNKRRATMPATKRTAKKATKSKVKQTGTTHRAIDAKRKAKAPGKRRSASGNTYTETRRNRSDADRKKKL